MRLSSLFVASLAVAIVSIALLLCGLSGTAMSQTATPSGGATISLPNVVVDAPKQVAMPHKPKQRAVARSTVSPRTSPTTPTPSASPMSPAAQLANATGSCVGGCVTNFRSATPLGTDVLFLVARCRERAETQATTKPTPSAWRPD
jgi:hypothetical protein